MMYEKTDRTGYYRDMNSGAIVNKDKDSLYAYKLKKQRANELNELKQKQDHIENELLEIKSLLRHALEKTNAE